MNESPTFSHSLYSTLYQWNLGVIVRFELKSFICRHLFNNPPPTVSHAESLLNLGCGNKIYPGFTNADFYRIRSSARPAGFWGVDLRYQLNCPDNHWDGIFTEHTLEHLYPDRVLALLKEIHRTLKPGAWVRIVVPDLSKYVAYYTGANNEPFFQKWPVKSAALRSLAQYYLHVSLWDHELMTECLREAGFQRVEPRVFGEGADSQLIKDSPERSPESLYIEAQKKPSTGAAVTGACPK